MDTKNTRVNNLSSTLLIISFIGFIITGYLFFQRYNPQNLSFNTVEISKNYEPEIQSEPVGVEIKTVNISLPISGAEIVNNRWESSTTGVSYLKTSAIPGQTGNAILYGHNWPNLLGNLKKVKPSEVIKIYYADGTSKEFIVEYTTEVKPSDIDVIKSSDDKRITIYTCSGFLDSKRFVVVAKPLV